VYPVSDRVRMGEMLPSLAHLLLSLLLLPTIAPLPSSHDNYNYLNDEGEEYDYSEGEGEERSEERFQATRVHVVMVSEKAHLVVPEEGVIRLPCRVENPDNIPIIWSHVRPSGAAQMAVGDKVIGSRVTVSVDSSGSTLLIPQAKASDSGEYMCQVATGQEDLPSLVHTVTVTAKKEGREEGARVGRREEGGQQAAVTSSSTTTSLATMVLVVVLVLGV